MSTGRVKKRAVPTERVLARVFREAGARVLFNAFLRDMNVGVPATDTRRIEVLAQDLPCFAGAQLAVDIMLRSALTRNGEAQAKPRTLMVQSCLKPDTTRNGATLSWQIDTGGRWSDEAAELVRQLAHARARDVPCHLG